jgi:flagellar M-ring protein FliF
MDRLKELFNRIKEGWTGLSRSRQIGIGVIVAGMITLAVIYGLFINQTEYVVLYSDLTSDEAAVIVDDLDTRGDIDYKLENNGQDILVDAEQVDSYRLDLAMNDLLPDSSTGYEIFDSQDMMTTDEDRAIMYQRALEGELEQTIMSLEEINAASVHLVIEEDSIYSVNEEAQSTASVVLDVKAGQELTEAQVTGIMSLVSGGVENLALENIKVVDSSGNLLSANITSDLTSSLGTNEVSTYYELTTEYENQIQEKVQGLLEKALGNDTVAVTVTAALDFDATQTQSTTYDDEPVVRSEEQSISGTGFDTETTTSGLVSDSISNVMDDTTTGDEVYSYDATINNEISNEIQETIEAPGSVERINVSVIYDGTLSDDQQETIENIVMPIMSFDSNRGDTLNIEGIAFDRTYEEELAEELAAAEAEMNAGNILQTILDNLYLIVFIIIAVIVIIFIFKTLFGGRKKEEDEEDVLLAAAGGPAVLSSEMAESGEVILNKDGEPIPNVFTDRPKSQEEIFNDQLKEYVDKSPEAVAEIIKIWMREY